MALVQRSLKIIGILLKNDIFNSVTTFFTNDKTLKEINHAFIAIIPKVPYPTQTNQYKPISLCPTIYNVISKILVNRLRPLLDKSMSLFQSAFIPGRSIHDNILLTHEIMHKYKNMKTKTAWTAIKLDIEKAYDKIKWDFIFKVLMEMGFHSTWISWIKECISSVSYSLIVNDEPNGLINPREGSDKETHSLLIFLSSAWKPFIMCFIFKLILSSQV